MATRTWTETDGKCRKNQTQTYMQYDEHKMYKATNIGIMNEQRFYK